MVIPVYNVEKYIEQALQSVLTQSYRNLEIIVVDDQSPDNSIALVEHLVARTQETRVQIVRQQNRGLAGARNSGIRAATGDFVAFLDSDDFWQADKIEQHMKLMLAQPGCGVSFCSSLFVDEQGQSLERLQAPAEKQQFDAGTIFCRNPIGNGSVPVIRRAILEQIAFLEKGKDYTQYFDESLRQSEDVECWTRIAIISGTEFAYIDQPLTNYRLNNGGLSADVDKQFETWSRVLHKLAQYAPEFAKRYGPIAQTFQYRYLARRCVFQGQGNYALQLMWRAFRTRPRVLFTESRKTLETLAASLLMVCLPRGLQLKLVEKLV
ncbi:MAG: glycosyltransferase [Gammaproteobacteria bacterium]|nr:glycosyltransferase [Gammaproteobacteria bacterium]